MRNAIFFCLFVFAIISAARSQTIRDSISEQEVSRIIHVLASDSLTGRGNFQPGLQKAAMFMENEFRNIGLQSLPKFQNYFLPFEIRNRGNSEIAYNVVGMLPGKSKAGEAIVISAHYDHMGILPYRKEDSIMNGANDNASGTTGMLVLAKYFAKRNDNERTLIFCAFAGEELGLKGSNTFVKQIDPDRIIANINLEMIGIPQYGKNKIFITGEKYSSLPLILRKELPKTFRIIREPDERKQLFMRSDNYSFAKKGIPAHTIMASDDDDACYHNVCDEVGRIDTVNMTVIITNLAIAMQSLISGEATPSSIRRFDY